MSNVKGKLSKAPGLHSKAPPRSHQLPAGSAVMTAERLYQREIAEQRRIRDLHADLKKNLNTHRRALNAVDALVRAALEHGEIAPKSFRNDDIFRYSAACWLTATPGRPPRASALEDALSGTVTVEANIIRQKIKVAIRPSLGGYDTSRLTAMQTELRVLVDAFNSLPHART